MIIAVLRPDSWKLPLFLHVLGATLLFGSIVVVTILAVAARRRAEPLPFARYAFRTWLALVIPSFVLMRVGAQWILSREKDQIPGLDKKGWVGTGFAVSDFGLVLLVALGIAAWLDARRGGHTRAGTAALVLSAVYVVALVVAWFAMSAKPGA